MITYKRLSNNKLEATNLETWIVKEADLRDEKQALQTIKDQCQARIDQINLILETV